MPISLIIRRAAFAALGGFLMDEGVRRIGGEDGAFSWTLRELFGNPRLADANACACITTGASTPSATVVARWACKRPTPPMSPKHSVSRLNWPTPRPQASCNCMRRTSVRRTQGGRRNRPQIQSPRPEAISICYNRRSSSRSVATGTANLHSLAARQARRLQSEGHECALRFLNHRIEPRSRQISSHYLERRA